MFVQVFQCGGGGVVVAGIGVFVCDDGYGLVQVDFEDFFDIGEVCIGFFVMYIWVIVIDGCCDWLVVIWVFIDQLGQVYQFDGLVFGQCMWVLVFWNRGVFGFVFVFQFYFQVEVEMIIFQGDWFFVVWIDSDLVIIFDYVVSVLWVYLMGEFIIWVIGIVQEGFEFIQVQVQCVFIVGWV